MRALATFGAMVVSIIWVAIPIFAWTVLAETHDLYVIIAIAVSFVAWISAFCALHYIFIPKENEGG